MVPVMMQEYELESFAAICVRHGLSADQFRVSDDDYSEVIGGHGVVSREVVVTHLASADRRRYLHDHFSNWLVVFESDVSGGRFSGHGLDW
jgi:hypothetical protein